MSEKSTQFAIAWTSSVRNTSQWLAVVSLVIAVTVIMGWLVGIGRLTADVPGWREMTVVNAAAQALVAGTLASRRIGERDKKLMLSVAGAAALAVVLTQVLTGADAVSSAIGGWITGTGGPVQRMSGESALSILLLAAVTWPSLRWSPPWMRDAAAGIVFLVALIVIVDHGYGSAGSTLLPFRSMSAISGISLLLLSVSAVLSRPGSGWAKVIASPELSGRVTRRQMLFALVPVILGFVLVRVSGSGVLPNSVAMSLLVVFTVIPLLWLVLRDGRRLVALDGERDEKLRLTQRYGAELQVRLDAQAESLRNEIRYRQLFDSIDAGFCVIEMKFDEAGDAVDYRFVEVNAAFVRQSGLAAAAGQWMRGLAPAHEQRWFDIYGKVARTGVSVRFESPASELDECWFDVFAFRVSGSTTGLVGALFNDITARRRVEMELQAVNETLEQRVEAAIAAREEAQSALRQSQKMEAIGQLTGGVAHDFNNLLTPILGSLDLLTRRGGLGEREQRLIGGALQSAERAKTLVQRLLAFARRQPLQPGPVDLGALVTNMAELVASTSGPQIRVSVDVAPGLPPAIGDANQLEMALLNLCVNARDAMPKGGKLSVSVGLSGPPPAFLDLPAGAYVRLSVADDGTGMDAETAARAIEPFFSTKEVGKGTGLGLSMVHGLVLQLGGALTIHSEPGMGTRIDLFLRSGDPMPTPMPASLEAAQPAMIGRVLVVDDQEQVRMLTANLLQELGFTTEECESGSLAELRLMAGETFDLVVTDHLMPGLTGAALASRLAVSRPEIPVLVVSGYVEVEGIAPGLNLLRKPFRKDELASAVTGALRDRKPVAVKPVGVSANPL